MELGTSGSTDETQTRKVRSPNGSMVPVEITQERTLREDATGKTVERIVHYYDLAGNPTVTERVLIEERKTPGGGSHIDQTTWATDINGNMGKREVQTSDTKVSGNTTTTNTTISRVSIGGGFAVAEKRNEVTETTGNRQEIRSSLQRAVGDGRLQEVGREVRVIEKSGAETRERSSVYEPGMISGELQLGRETERTSTRRPDGSELTQVNLLSRGPNVPNQKVQIAQQEVIEKRKQPDGSVVETVSRRLPSAEPGVLGVAELVSETVCKGKCN
jgi:hypothetical protein